VEGGRDLPPVLKTIAKRENGTNMRPAILLFAVALASIHPSAWKGNSRKFTVARSHSRAGLRASGRGYAGFCLHIQAMLVAFVARDRCERIQVVAF